VLLRPDTEVPEYAFAWAGEGSAGEPVTYDIAATDTRMKTFGPVLAENLLRRGGENRPYLAQRAAMRAVGADHTLDRVAPREDVPRLR
jgi:hypothetical protein